MTNTGARHCRYAGDDKRQVSAGVVRGEDGYVAVDKNSKIRKSHKNDDCLAWLRRYIAPPPSSAAAHLHIAVGVFISLQITVSTKTTTSARTRVGASEWGQRASGR